MRDPWGKPQVLDLKVTFLLSGTVCPPEGWIEAI